MKKHDKYEVITFIAIIIVVFCGMRLLFLAVGCIFDKQYALAAFDLLLSIFVFCYPLINLIKLYKDLTKDDEKVQVCYRYQNDGAFCRSFVCSKIHMPKPGMKVRLLVSYGTLVSIEQKGINDRGMAYYVGYVVEDSGKTATKETYEI